MAAAAMNRRRKKLIKTVKAVRIWMCPAIDMPFRGKSFHVDEKRFGEEDGEGKSCTFSIVFWYYGRSRPVSDVRKTINHQSFKIKKPIPRCCD